MRPTNTEIVIKNPNRKNFLANFDFLFQSKLKLFMVLQQFTFLKSDFFSYADDYQSILRFVREKKRFFRCAHIKVSVNIDSAIGCLCSDA